MKKSTLFLPFAFCILLLLSCNRSDRNNDRESASVVDNLLGLNIVNDVYNQVMEAASGQTEFAKVQSGCATISVFPAAPDSTFPKTLTIDYGTSDCPDNNNISRRGKLVAAFSNKPRVYNASITVSFQDYYYKGKRVTGIYSITNKGLNAQHHYLYHIMAEDMHISVNDKEGYIHYACAYKKEWVNGDSTTETTDDAFYITGTSSGINHLGNPYTTAIDSSLRTENSCRYIVSGIIHISPDNLSVRKMDFGDGSCDGNSIYNINGYSYSFSEN